MESPDIYILSQVRWDFFATLTFKASEQRLQKMPERAKFAMLFAWLREVAEMNNTYFPELLFAVRPEKGEMTGRFHFHALLGNTKLRPSVRTCHRVRHAWSALEGNAGMARVTVFDPHRDAGSYLTKPEPLETCTRGGLRTGGHARVGGDVYESKKFGQVENLVISKSVYRRIAANRGVEFSE